VPTGNPAAGSALLEIPQHGAGPFANQYGTVPNGQRVNLVPTGIIRPVWLEWVETRAVAGGFAAEYLVVCAGPQAAIRAERDRQRVMLPYDFQVAARRQQLDTAWADPALRTPARKVLTSLQEHWSGLTLFVDDPRIPMDNNRSERILRGPALGRKNFYGSGAEWSGRLAAALFSIFATLKLWQINPRLWLQWYLQSCCRGRRAGAQGH